METQNDTTNFRKKTLWQTVCMTLVVLVLLVLLIGLIWSVAAPGSAGSFFYSVGMKNLSAKVSLRAANESKEIEDFYIALLRANDAKSYKYVTYAAEKMLFYSGDEQMFTSAQYDAFVEAKDTELDVVTTSTDQFICSVYVYAKMRVEKCNDLDGSIFKQATSYCKGTSVYYYYNSVCPITNYINALIDVKKVDDAVVYETILQMRLLNEATTTSSNKQWRTNNDNSLTTSSNFVSAQIAMAQDIAKLLDKKGITQTTAAEFSASHGPEYLNAYTYWLDIINAA